MNFSEYLKGLDLETDVIDKIVKGMPENKLYIANEENLDSRYAKLKEQKDALDASNKSQDDLIKQLQSTVKDNEDAVAKIDTYKTEAETAKAAQANIVKSYAAKDALTKAGAKDTDYMLYKMGGLDKLEVDKDGNIKDFDSQIKQLQESNPDYFNTTDPNADKDGNGGNGGYKPLDNQLDGGTQQTPEEAAAASFAASVGIKE